MATLIVKSITRNQMTSTEQPAQILLQTTEIGGSVKQSVDIVNPFRTDIANRMETTIQPTIMHFNQATGMVNSDRNHFPIGIWILVLMFPYPGGILVTALG